MTTLNAQNIALRVEELEKSFAEINMTSQGIISTVSDLSNSMSQIKQTSGSITSTVQSLDKNMEKSASSIEQYANKIKFSVTQGNFGSTLEQNPRSFLATFNQCSKYALLDDTEGLKLGDRTKGTYSKVRYDGHLELMMEGESYPYHCLTYTGNFIGIESNDANDDPAYFDVPIPNKFKGIPISQLSISVSIAKSYPPDDKEDSYYVAHGVGVWWEEKDDTHIRVRVVSTFRHYEEDGTISQENEAIGGRMNFQITITG